MEPVAVAAASRCMEARHADSQDGVAGPELSQQPQGRARGRGRGRGRGRARVNAAAVQPGRAEHCVLQDAVDNAAEDLEVECLSTAVMEQLSLVAKSMANIICRTTNIDLQEEMLEMLPAIRKRKAEDETEAVALCCNPGLGPDNDMVRQQMMALLCQYHGRVQSGSRKPISVAAPARNPTGCCDAVAVSAAAAPQAKAVVPAEPLQAPEQSPQVPAAEAVHVPQPAPQSGLPAPPPAALPVPAAEAVLRAPPPPELAVPAERFEASPCTLQSMRAQCFVDSEDSEMDCALPPRARAVTAEKVSAPEDLQAPAEVSQASSQAAQAMPSMRAQCFVDSEDSETDSAPGERCSRFQCIFSDSP